MTAAMTDEIIAAPMRTGEWLLADQAETAARLDEVVQGHKTDESPRARRLALLSQIARAALAEELMNAIRAVLTDSIVDLLVAAWARHEALVAAGQETLAHPGAQSLVTLAKHTIEVHQMPDLELRVDGIRVVTLHVALDVTSVVGEAVAVVRDGRLVEVRAGDARVEAVLQVDGIEVARKSARLQLDAGLALNPGIKLVDVASLVGVPLDT